MFDFSKASGSKATGQYCCGTCMLAIQDVLPLRAQRQNMALMFELANTDLSTALQLVSTGLMKEDDVDLNLKTLVQFLAFAPDIFCVSTGKTFNPSVSRFHMYKTGMKIRALSHPCSISSISLTHFSRQGQCLFACMQPMAHQGSDLRQDPEAVAGHTNITADGARAQL